MKYGFRMACIAASLAALSACSPEQRENVDSVAGSVESTVRSTFSVLNVDMGRRLDADKDIADETETFAPTDTIYASVSTTGTAKAGTVVSRWTFPDGSTVDQQADSAAVANRLLFFITKPEGLAKGKYTFRVIVDGREVRSKDVTVQ